MARRMPASLLEGFALRWWEGGRLRMAGMMPPSLLLLSGFCNAPSFPVGNDVHGASGEQLPGRPRLYVAGTPF